MSWLASINWPMLGTAQPQLVSYFFLSFALLSFFLGFLLWADLFSNWLMISKAILLIGCWELTYCGQILVRAKSNHFPDESWRRQANIVATIICNVVLGFWNFGYDFWGVGDEFADMCTEKCPLMPMGGKVEWPACILGHIWDKYKCVWKPLACFSIPQNTRRISMDK